MYHISNKYEQIKDFLGFDPANVSLCIEPLTLRLLMATPKKASIQCIRCDRLTTHTFHSLKRFKLLRFCGRVCSKFRPKIVWKLFYKFNDLIHESLSLENLLSIKILKYKAFTTFLFILREWILRFTIIMKAKSIALQLWEFSSFFFIKRMNAKRVQLAWQGEFQIKSYYKLLFDFLPNLQ